MNPSSRKRFSATHHLGDARLGAVAIQRSALTLSVRSVLFGADLRAPVRSQTWSLRGGRGCFEITRIHAMRSDAKRGDVTRAEVTRGDTTRIDAR